MLSVNKDGKNHTNVLYKAKKKIIMVQPIWRKKKNQTHPSETG